MKLKPSSNKTEKGSWNNFNSNSLDRFVNLCHPEFVDIIPGKSLKDSKWDCWVNKEDTVVIKLPSLVGWEVVEQLNALYCDEFDYIPLSNAEVVIRLWWD
jgi:hypothetical protein